MNAVLSWLDPIREGEKSVGIKANISVQGYICHGGIKAYENDVATEDALVVKRLRKAGFNVAAILNMEEGALGAQTDNPWFGKTYNPIKPGYTPGGSSGGSSAAVAGQLVDMALGTDTMGSVRIPSAYCGLWGFKPSHSREMLEGVMPLSPVLDTVGAHAHSLNDVVRLTEVICAQDFSQGQIGDIHLLDYSGKVDVDDDVQRCFDKFHLKLGKITKTNLEHYAFGKSRRAGLILSEVEGYAVHADRLDESPKGFSNFFRGMLEYGRDLPLDRIDGAYAHLKELREATFPDFILMPTAPQTAFKFGSPVPANQADFTAFANLADRPAIQFPIGKSEAGLPIGAQLVGPRGREADLVATVMALDI